jgi:hypothetical protein
MMNVLEAPPDAPTISIADLDAEIKVYESVYGISTEVLLGWIAEGDARLADVRDADFWRSAHEARERMRRYCEMHPENITEDPKGSSVHLWPSTLTSMRLRPIAPFRR